MLLVLLSWCYLFAIALNLGLACSRFLKLQLKNTATLIFTGLFSAAILAGIWAIFGRIHWEFQLALLLLNGLILLWNRHNVSEHFEAFYIQFRSLPKTKKLLLGLSMLTYAFVCSAPAYFPDHEIYYLQTVKWINEYGLVKGLANLHLFFGQTSGWHILQGAFSFSFLGLGLHTLNGFCLLVGNWYVISNTGNAKTIAFLPIANVLLFPFIAVASPDLAVVVIGFVIFHQFLEAFKRCTTAQFNALILLCLFVVYIKITAAPILLLPLSVWIADFRVLAKKIIVGYFAALLVFALLVVKNVLLNGYPLFPLSVFQNKFASDYALPPEIHAFAFNPARRFDFFLSHADYEQMNGLQIIVRWLFHSGLGSIFNLAIVLLILVVPLLNEFSQRKYRLLYAVMLVQLVLLFATSPQPRFILHFVVFFAALLVTKAIRDEKTMLTLSVITSVSLLVPTLFGWHYPWRNVDFSERTFSVVNIIIPAPDSNLKAAYDKASVGNLDYYSPDANTYIWATGNGPLPCVNEKQLQYLWRKTDYIPQLRTHHLKDGFRSVKATRHDP